MECRKAFGKGLGGQQRLCKDEVGHEGRHTDMPFLRALDETHPKVSDKIQRDALNTRGASWGKKQDGQQKRRNRQPRWTLKTGDFFFPAHAATYDTCLEVARKLTSHVYGMKGAPGAPPQVRALLPKQLNEGLCPVCLTQLDFDDFAKAKRSRAEIETAHIDPKAPSVHTAENVAFAHRQCNIAQGERSIPSFVLWCADIIRRHKKT